MISNSMLNVTVTSEPVTRKQYSGTDTGFIVIQCDKWGYVCRLECIYFHLNHDITLLSIACYKAKLGVELAYWLHVASLQFEAELSNYRKDCRFSSHPELGECLTEMRPVVGGSK
jgi:hypothetical protein